MADRQLRTGYIKREHQPEHPVFGSANSVRGTITNSGGQWLKWIPPQDVQQNTGIESESCTSYGTLDAVETLLRMLYNDDTVWSKRWIAWKSGTTQQGNDPMTVAQTLKTWGDVPDADWPTTPDLNTWEKLFASPPAYLTTKAIEFYAKYVFEPEWVPVDTAGPLMSALDYSPLGVAGYAWAQDENGLYYTPPGAAPCHWFALIGYVPNEYWIVFDSYENDIKHLRWDYQFTEAMRYSITLRPQPAGQWTWLTAWINKMIALVTNKTT